MLRVNPVVCHEAKAAFTARLNSDVVRFQTLRQFGRGNTGICTQAEEISALGAAFMAGLTVGIWHDVSELDSLRQTGREYQPLMEAEQRQRYYNGWRRAVQSVLDSAKR